eukprot:comp21395_c0_seq1/m.29454 comp21395_c0_seq1/g.29454  ORF comp21395_c0_seq1/g.29454 comp21395_c0_seq1/m.29454 type:complete len:167 (-) comp21395_c0_seq1:510-1010(-)
MRYQARRTWQRGGFGLHSGGGQVQKGGTSATSIQDTDPFGALQHLVAARSNPAAVSLARQLNIDLPANPLPTPGRGLFYYLRPLVQCGLDTDENIALLFGSKDWVRKTHWEVRMSFLMPNQAVTTSVDKYYTVPPSVPFMPRPPSREEQEAISRVQELQRVLQSMQ